MPICPNQHESRTPDFCEVCGVEIPPGAAGEAAGSVKETCPACQAEHDPAVGIYCEVCGYNFKTGVAPGPAPSAQPPAQGQASAPPPVLELVVSVATSPHDGTPDAQPPPALAPRVQPLDRATLLIGRTSIRRNISPDIALDHDDSVSHRHAQLTRTADGAFSLSDLGSSNGTTLNGAQILPGATVVLKEGDVIALGGWTCLTLRRTGQDAEPTLSLSSDSPR